MGRSVPPRVGGLVDSPCRDCDGVGRRWVLLGSKTGLVFLPCPTCHGFGRLAPPEAEAPAPIPCGSRPATTSHGTSHTTPAGRVSRPRVVGVELLAGAVFLLLAAATLLGVFRPGHDGESVPRLVGGAQAVGGHEAGAVVLACLGLWFLWRGLLRVLDS